MARPAAGYMMEAVARRAGDEDCLTELLACVVAGDEQFASELLGLAGLPGYRARSSG